MLGLGTGSGGYTGAVTLRIGEIAVDCADPELLATFWCGVLGYRVGLCDLTAGEMGSNGTVEERLAEAEAAREVLGAAWRVNLRLPDRAIGSDREHVRAVAALVRRARPRSVAPRCPRGP